LFLTAPELFEREGSETFPDGPRNFDVPAHVAVGNFAPTIKESSMNRKLRLAAAVFSAVVGLGAVSYAGLAVAEETVMVGGAPMYPSKSIVENAVNSKDHTTLVAAVKAAGLVDTLAGPGPFTVFAPTNEAFVALPAGTVDTLLKPENKAMLTGVLTYHVVPGRLTSADLAAKIKQGGGKAVLKTVAGGDVTVMMDGGKFEVTDAKGGVSHVTIADVLQSNGVIFVVDKVLIPG